MRSEIYVMHYRANPPTIGKYGSTHICPDDWNASHSMDYSHSRINHAFPEGTDISIVKDWFLKEHKRRADKTIFECQRRIDTLTERLERIEKELVISV